MNDDLLILVVNSVDMSYTGDFREPSFGLFANWLGFQKTAFATLSRFGLKLADIKVESTSSNPADLSVACWVLGYTAVVRYRLDNVEVWSNSRTLTDETAVGLLRAALDVVHQTDQTAFIGRQTINVAINAKPVAGRVADHLRRFVPHKPPGDPPFVPGGVSFFRALSQQESGSVVFERSNSIPSGAFLRFVVQFGGATKEDRLVAVTRQFVFDAYDLFAVRVQDQ